MPPTNSRLNLARAAIRPAMRGRIMLAGPSGAGKTWTSLVIADVLHDEHADPGKRTLVIDTEKESALTYADVFEFDHLRWKAPFDPRNLADTLLDPALDERYDVVIVDSFTHYWRGTGGTLDIANGKYTGWADARPAQVDVVEAVLECAAHVIVCVREKQDHAQVEDRPGHWVVQKLGLAPIQDDTFEYEVNVSLDIDMQHTLNVSKSRTNAVPVGSQFHAGHAADFAVTYRDWLAAGEPVVSKHNTDALIETFKRIDDQAERAKAKSAFLAEFGRPEFLLESRYKEACEWVADVVLAASGGEVTGHAVGEDGSGDEAGHEHGDDVPDVTPSPAATPDVTTPPEDTPSGAPQAPVSDPAPDAAHEAPESVSPPQDAAHEAAMQAVLADVNAMPTNEVQQALIDASLNGNGAPKTLRKRLAAHRIGLLTPAE